MAEEDRVEQLVRSMAAQRGGRIVAEWEFLARMDYEFMATYNEVAQKALGYYDEGEDAGAGSAKLKELVAVAMLAGQRDADLLRAHLRRALALGATDREVVDVLQVAMVTSGAPSIRLGLEILLELRDAAAS